MQGEPRYAGLRDHPDRRGKAERGGLVVEVAEPGAPLNPAYASARIDLDAAHRGDINDQAVSDDG